MASILKEENADFVGLQEVVYPQLNDLIASLERYDHLCGRKDGKTKGEYSPIFYKKEKFKVLKSNTFGCPKPLTQSPKVGMPLWNVSVLMGIPKPNNLRENMGFNTHFDHRGEKARINSVDLLVKKVNLLNSENLPVIITGDFNLTPDQAPIQKMQFHFTDVQKNLPESDPQYGTSNGFDTEKIRKKELIIYL